MNNISLKCSIWEMNENAEMSMAADDSSHYPLKHIADLPTDCSIA